MSFALFNDLAPVFDLLLAPRPIAYVKSPSIRSQRHRLWLWSLASGRTGDASFCSDILESTQAQNRSQRGHHNDCYHGHRHLGNREFPASRHHCPQPAFTSLRVRRVSNRGTCDLTLDRVLYSQPKRPLIGRSIVFSAMLAAKGHNRVQLVTRTKARETLFKMSIE